MDVDAYLRRIEYDGPRRAFARNSYAALHRSHLYTVPFENLDIALGDPHQSWIPGFCTTRSSRGVVAASAMS